ncbi:hypothetical protein KP509_28G014300 [Ceratopteris richardii]|uniref:Glycosyltransferase n=1 Tax=Ceratopteris richardii TaxID=49495 RepID=A0A8T2R9P3_CERRI|nr:hypothetical protein KP509_28G014300 [Ceratopteris richardii]
MAEVQPALRNERSRGTLKPHFLALPFPFHGHVNPLLQLSLKYAGSGVAVTLLNIPYYHSRVTASVQSLVDRSGLPLGLLSLRDDYPLPDLRIRGSMDICLQRVATVMAEEVESIVCSFMERDPSFSFTCLLADVRIPFAQRVAKKFSIPWIAFWTQSAASFSYHMALANGLHLPADELAVIEGIPGVPSHTVSRAPAISRRDIVGDFIFDFITKPFLHIHGALAVLINTMSCIEAEALNALRSQGLNVLPVGPLLPSCCGSSESTCSSEKSADIMTREKHPCLRWLDTQEPGSVLYISFGTLVCLEETTFTELVLGIEASGLSFLWSLRSDMVAGNHGLFLEAFKERTNHKGKIWPWVPQLEVLSHSSIGGFFTHCGWNSSLESMCRGVPMIGMPIFGEQKLNLLCLEDRWNVCVAMEAENICRSQVQRTVSAFFEGAVVQKLRGNAEKVRDAATAAMAMDGSSSVNIMRALQLTSGGGLDDNIANGRDSRSKQGSWN